MIFVITYLMIGGVLAGSFENGYSDGFCIALIAVLWPFVIPAGAAYWIGTKLRKAWI